MAGIYIHIPFCKQACHYCNFHFSTQLKGMDDMVDAIVQEIWLTRDHLPTTKLASLYFGGGTPSLLTDRQLGKIMDTVHKQYQMSTVAEITLEANPDDINLKKVSMWKALGINRLSVGIQSFFDKDLEAMNRSHNGVHATRCVEDARAGGIETLSIDLIYGAHTTTKDMWLANIQKALQLEVNHISAYCLTVEDHTALSHFVRKGTVPPVDEDKAFDQYQVLVQQLNSHGWHHYEVSNFAQPGQYAVHNTKYWKGQPYLGIGPAAHSYLEGQRGWNIAHNPQYVAAIAQGKVPRTTEALTDAEQYNEYLMTGLRTMWGIDKRLLSTRYPTYWSAVEMLVDPMVAKGLMYQDDDVIRLTELGFWQADGIASTLMWVDGD